MNALLIDTVEYPPDWKERRVIEEWFGPLFATVEHLRHGAVAASHPDCAARALAADAVVVTGSARDADSEEPAVLKLCETLRTLTSQNVPVLGVCFGHQILARALGGVIGRNPKGWEVGNTRISLTPAGMDCPLLAGLGQSPLVLQSHQDAVLALPPGAVLLAGNAHTPVQAFQSRPGGRQFGIQFHPEFTPERLQTNWLERRSAPVGSFGFDLEAALDHAQATPDTASVIPRFYGMAAR